MTNLKNNCPLAGVLELTNHHLRARQVSPWNFQWVFCFLWLYAGLGGSHDGTSALSSILRTFWSSYSSQVSSSINFLRNDNWLGGIKVNCLFFTRHTWSHWKQVPYILALQQSKTLFMQYQWGNEGYDQVPSF